MSTKCPACGGQVSCVGHWLGPIMSHEANDNTCLRVQLAAAAQQVAALTAQVERAEQVLRLAKDGLERHFARNHAMRERAQCCEGGEERTRWNKNAEWHEGEIDKALDAVNEFLEREPSPSQEPKT